MELVQGSSERNCASCLWKCVPWRIANLGWDEHHLEGLLTIFSLSLIVMLMCYRKTFFLNFTRTIMLIEW